MGHVECAVLPCLNGLTPSSDKPNLKFSGFAAKSGNFSSICTHAGESTTERITSASEWFPWYHWRWVDIAGDLYIRFNLGIKGKCLKTRAGIVLDPGMYLYSEAHKTIMVSINPGYHIQATLRMRKFKYIVTSSPH
jgi:hypothetical protein